MALTSVPMPTGFAGLDDLPKQHESLINCFNTGEAVIRTPGIDRFATGAGTGRGSVTWFADNMAYQVSGNRFIRVNEDGTTVDLGLIEGDAPCQFSQGQVNLVVVVEGGNAYFYNSENGLRQITDSDYRPSVSADFLRGRHYFVPADGSPLFYSEVDNPNDISPLNFIDAESLPDVNRYLINISDELVVLGTDATEFFRTTPEVTTPIVVRDGSRVDVGYIGGGSRLADTFAFIGRRRGQAPKIYAMRSGDPLELSNSAVNELLTDEYTMAELEQARGCRFEWKGYEIVAFRLSRHTLAFSGGNWFFLDSRIDRKVSPWRAFDLSYAYGRYIVSDSRGPQIGVLSSSTQQLGEDFEMGLDTFIRGQRASFFRLSRIDLDCLTGQDGKTVSLSLSKDGRTFGDFFAVGLGAIGDYSRRVKWQMPGGLGLYENFCGVRIRTRANVEFSLESIQADIT